MLTVLNKLKGNTTIHDLKIEQKHFEDIIYHRKRIETRLNDRNYQCGDVLYLREIRDSAYTGREILVVVDFVTNEYQLDSYVGMNFRVLVHNVELKECAK